MTNCRIIRFTALDIPGFVEVWIHPRTGKQTIFTNWGGAGAHLNDLDPEAPVAKIIVSTLKNHGVTISGD